MTLKELRHRCGLTQPEAAALLGVPMRTYCRYEGEPRCVGTFKYEALSKTLDEYRKDRVLSVDDIRESIREACSAYPVDACYLFGSYAKEKATAESDVDLMIVSSIQGIEYYGLLGDLQERLGKKVDLLRLEVATQNMRLMTEILKDGVRIY